MRCDIGVLIQNRIYTMKHIITPLKAFMVGVDNKNLFFFLRAKRYQTTKNKHYAYDKTL